MKFKKKNFSADRSAAPIQSLLVASLIAFIAFPASSRANIIGTDAQNFNPTTNGIDFVTVQSSETLTPGFLNFGAFANYATNTLPRYGVQSPRYSDGLIGTDLNFGVGILQNWDAGVSFPAVIYQRLNNPGVFSGHFADKGFTEAKLNTKYRFFGDAQHGVGIVLSGNFNFIRDNPYVGENAKPSLNAELVGDHTIGRYAVGLNVGHRWRNPGTPFAHPPILPFRNQWIGSLATSYHMPKWDTKFIIEVFGSTPSSRAGGLLDRQQSALEGLIGAKHDFRENFSSHIGFGRKLLAADIASPDFRVYIGLNFALGPVFAKPVKADQLRTPEPPLYQYTAEDPLAAVEPEPTGSERLVTQSLYFGFNSSKLDDEAEAEQVFESLVDVLKQKPYTQITVEGHTDSVGDSAYNQKLSESRAGTIRKHLVSKYKIDGSKIKVKGFGETRPIADNGNFQGRAQNRRVEFVIERTK